MAGDDLGDGYGYQERRGKGWKQREAERDDLDAKLDSLARKRDHAADVLGKPLLALTYQMEIDAILDGKPGRMGPPIHDVT